MRDARFRKADTGRGVRGVKVGRPHSVVFSLLSRMAGTQFFTPFTSRRRGGFRCSVFRKKEPNIIAARVVIKQKAEQNRDKTCLSIAHTKSSISLHLGRLSLKGKTHLCRPSPRCRVSRGKLLSFLHGDFQC